MQVSGLKSLMYLDHSCSHAQEERWPAPRRQTKPDRSAWDFRQNNAAPFRGRLAGNCASAVHGHVVAVNKGRADLFTQKRGDLVAALARDLHGIG